MKISFWIAWVWLVFLSACSEKNCEMVVEQKCTSTISEVSVVEFEILDSNAVKYFGNDEDTLKSERFTLYVSAKDFLLLGNFDELGRVCSELDLHEISSLRPSIVFNYSLSEWERDYTRYSQKRGLELTDIEGFSEIRFSDSKAWTGVDSLPWVSFDFVDTVQESITLNKLNHVNYDVNYALSSSKVKINFLYRVKWLTTDRNYERCQVDPLLN